MTSIGGMVLLVCLTLNQVNSVEVKTLADLTIQGNLESLSKDSAIVKTESDVVTIPINEILSIRSTTSQKPPSIDPFLTIRLADGSMLRVRSCQTSGPTLAATHVTLGEIKIPVASISSIKFSASDAKIDSEWDQLVDRVSKKDMVAIRKGDSLDHLDGVVGTLGPELLQFQLDGDDIAIKREKIFGLIYSKRESIAKKAIGHLELMSGDRLAVKQIGWDGRSWKTRLVTGLEIDIPAGLPRTLDFSVSRISYLSDLEPRSVKHTPYFDIPDFHVFDYRRDRDFDGNKISLGHTTYAKGLAIHSQTLMKYRLGGDYRRFQAVMGIGDEIHRGNVDVTIKADDKMIFSSSVNVVTRNQAGDVERAAPRMLDLDVSNVVELEIFVDFGSDKADIGDRLYLGNARLVR